MFRKGEKVRYLSPLSEDAIPTDATGTIANLSGEGNNYDVGDDLDNSQVWVEWDDPTLKPCWVGVEYLQKMERKQALDILWGRMRDFAKWSSHRGQTPVSIYQIPSDEDVESHREEIAAFIRERLSVVRNDSAWLPGGWKRKELDEAFVTLGLPPLEP